MRQREALVVGCGVIGLSSAVRLQEAGWRVRVWAAALPAATTSSVAAAIWYPYRVSPQDLALRWGQRSYEVFERLAREPGSGVRLGDGVEIAREPLPDPWWSAAVPGVRRCSAAELPASYADGFALRVPVVEMPLYLAWLLARFRAAGGAVEQRRVASLDEACDSCAVVVHCAGVGARDLAADPAVVPIRGQVVRVRNPGLRRFVLDETHPEGVTYIVPRRDDVVLGGSAEDGCWDLRADPATADAIVRRCVALEPRLTGADVLGHGVGLRPGRPAVRLEVEQRTDRSRVVHNYGHGGAGVTLSWGCADEVVRLLESAPSPLQR